MKVNIGLKEQDLQATTELLNKLLANEHILYMKTRNAHWNVVGKDFHAQHLFFETQYSAIQTFIDDIAERVRALGHIAVATLKQYLELTHLDEEEFIKNDSISYIKALLSDHESIIIQLRADIEVIGEKYGDEGTADFLTGLMESHEKMAWMLRAHLS
ncbi:DNA starvation/stationary phase protection protein [Sphingobacteriaceae bacterium WQ 2009]|uniref:DNA starvation/stationary phase protection protein n=1 Tax=Rhinopithecimicrobium faecis TaxID=2820698 RepID=A0A8T4HD31_9SPHI|nr:DNA starvation/stationary phase protection protein [Sphingobacteriaceae bacterium WQ 2009]